MVYCAAVGCKNDSRYARDVAFYKLDARSEECKREWLVKLRRENFTPSRHTVVCADHFSSDAFERDFQAELLGLQRPRKLKPDAVPTIFTYQLGGKRRLTSESRIQAKIRKQRTSKTIATLLDESPSLEKEKDTATADHGTTTELLQSGPACEPADLSKSVSVQTDNIVFPPIFNLPIMPTSISHSTQTECDRTCTTSATQYEEDDFAFSTCTTGLTSVSTIHSYSKAEPVSPLCTSTPIKNKPVCNIINTASPCNVHVDESSLSFSTADVSSGSEFVPDANIDSDTCTDDDDDDDDDEPFRQNDVSVENEQKYIVFESCILRLFQKCNTCECPNIRIHKTTVGTMLKVTCTCSAGHDFTWYSQPSVKRMPAGNLLVSAALLYTGGSFSQISNFVELLKLKFIGKSTFHKIQCDLFSVINEAWLQERQERLNEVAGKQLWLAGDGRCDSPGFSAKYGTYTLLDQESGKILDFCVTHVSEVDNKSTNMEKFGLKRTLTRLQDSANVAVLATDRHVQVAHLMRTQFPSIVHQYDVWHVAKSLSKKLGQKVKMKGCDDLQPWVQSIINHFWWSVATCDEDPVMLKEKWMSVVNHCVNIHEWSCNEVFHACEHPPLSGSRAKWLKPGSKAHVELQSVVFDKFLLKGVEKLTSFCHTGELEVFHSMMLKYCPKRQHFSYEGMVARTQLAALDHNNGTGRGQAVSSCGGELMYKQVFPKVSKRWVVKPVYEKKHHQYRNELMTRTVQVRAEGLNLPPVQKPTLPKNIATMPKPPKQDAIDSHWSRMCSSTDKE